MRCPGAAWWLRAWCVGTLLSVDAAATGAPPWWHRAAAAAAVEASIRLLFLMAAAAPQMPAATHELLAWMWWELTGLGEIWEDIQEQGRQMIEEQADGVVHAVLLQLPVRLPVGIALGVHRLYLAWVLEQQGFHALALWTAAGALPSAASAPLRAYNAGLMRRAARHGTRRRRTAAVRATQQDPWIRTRGWVLVVEQWWFLFTVLPIAGPGWLADGWALWVHAAVGIAEGAASNAVTMHFTDRGQPRAGVRGGLTPQAIAAHAAARPAAGGAACHICFCDVVAGETVRVLRCGHEYHVPCIDPWLLKLGEHCPLCFAQVCPPEADTAAAAVAAAVVSVVRGAAAPAAGPRRRRVGAGGRVGAAAAAQRP